jgi:uncharacterized membrane-anchored protein YjiN (DUF445 family)
MSDGTEMDVKVKVGSDMMEQAVKAAIMQVFTPEKQEQMVTEAIMNLLNEKARWDENKTKIQEILDDEVRRWVANFAQKMVEENIGGIRTKMEELVAKGMSRFLADEEMQEKMAEKLSKALGGVFLYGRDY